MPQPKELKPRHTPHNVALNIEEFDVLFPSHSVLLKRIDGLVEALREIRSQVCLVPLGQITALEEHIRKLAEAALAQAKGGE